MATETGLKNAAARRVRILERIREHVTTKGYPPIAQDLATAEGVHRSMVQKDLSALRDAGLIEVDEGVRVSGMRLTGYRVVLVPIAPDEG